eukprot:6494567-Pyramimonas_sp.AAC.2
MPKAQARLASVPENRDRVADDDVDVLLWWVAGAIHALRGVVVLQSKRPAAEPRVPLLLQQQQPWIDIGALVRALPVGLDQASVSNHDLSVGIIILRLRKVYHRNEAAARIDAHWPGPPPERICPEHKGAPPVWFYYQTNVTYAHWQPPPGISVAVGVAEGSHSGVASTHQLLILLGRHGARDGSARCRTRALAAAHSIVAVAVAISAVAIGVSVSEAVRVAAVAVVIDAVAVVIATMPMSDVSIGGVVWLWNDLAPVVELLILWLRPQLV